MTAPSPHTANKAGVPSAALKVLTKAATAAKDAAKNPAGAQRHEQLGMTKADLLHWHHQMLYMRRFEERAASLYQQGQIAGFCHLYIGQEAVAAAAKAASVEGDDFITSYRCHAMALACGLDGQAIMSELTGRSTGISKGKGGSMHMFSPEKHFWGGHGIVAAQVPIGAGLAFGAKYRKEPRVCFTFIGDGAMNAGQVFESFNMAALWKLPVIFVIENNQYGMGTSVPRAAAGNGLVARGEAFGMLCRKVDGMNFLDSYEAYLAAAEHARSGKGPVLLEMDTYRYRGHSMSDPAKYRTREDVDQVKEARDPIVGLQKYLLAEGLVKATELDALDEEIKATVSAIADKAVTDPIAELSELTTDVYPDGSF